MFLDRNKMIFAKVESTYGTDPVPVEGSDAILTKGVARGLYEGNRVTRDLDYPYMGNDNEVNAAPFTTITFDVELAGAAAAGTAPQLSALLRACGMSETIVVSTSVTYAPISTGFESCTIYYFLDGERQIISGARGTFTLNMSRGGLPMLSFTMTGKYVRPTAVALPDPTYTAIDPSPFSNANTPTFSVHGQAVFGEALSVNIGNEVVHRNLSGFDGILQIDRAVSANVVFHFRPKSFPIGGLTRLSSLRFGQVVLSFHVGGLLNPTEMCLALSHLALYTTHQAYAVLYLLACHLVQSDGVILWLLHLLVWGLSNFPS